MQEWYLLTPNTRPNAIGGYENQAFIDYKEDAFQEALTTNLATTVLLYNSNMSNPQQIRCIIQNNVADTQLKSLERTVLGTIGTFKAGMYIFFENRFWLLTGYPGNNGVYEKITMVLCQYKLKWQCKNGNIIERWANFTSASKYDTGRTGNQILLLASNNFTILVPDDDLSATLDDKRVFIDRDIKNPRKVFRITRSDDVLYLYGESHGGILSFIADRDELNLQTDRPDLFLCNYISQHQTCESGSGLTAKIIGKPIIKNGYYRDFEIRFTNPQREPIENINFAWNIVSDFEVQQQIKGNIITLLVDNETCIGKTFLLQIIIAKNVADQIEIMVVEAF